MYFFLTPVDITRPVRRTFSSVVRSTRRFRLLVFRNDYSAHVQSSSPGSDDLFANSDARNKNTTYIGFTIPLRADGWYRTDNTVMTSAVRRSLSTVRTARPMAYTNTVRKQYRGVPSEHVRVPQQTHLQPMFEQRIPGVRCFQWAKRWGLRQRKAVKLAFDFSPNRVRDWYKNDCTSKPRYRERQYDDNSDIMWHSGGTEKSKMSRIPRARI